MAIYELRLYSIVAGRLEVCLDRFENHLPRLFARHGIRHIGSWVATAGPSGPAFAYMMAYKSLAERESQWSDFYADAEWWRVRGETQGEEEAVERFDLYFMASNGGWSPSLGDAHLHSGLFDLILAETLVGRGKATNEFLVQHYLPSFERAGARISLIADLLSGLSLPKVAMLVVWPDAHARRVGWNAVNADRDLTTAIAAARATHGRPLLGRTETFVLEATAFALPNFALGWDLEREPIDIA